MKRYRIQAIMRTLNRRPMALEEAETPYEAVHIARGYQAPDRPAIQIVDNTTGETLTPEQFAAKHDVR